MTAEQLKTERQTSALLDTLAEPCRRLADCCDQPETPLVDLLHVLQYDETLCLRCRTADRDLFLDWDPDGAGLCETERTDSGSRGPRATGPVRAAAAIERAETVDLVPVTRTPFADRPFHPV